MDQVRPWHQQRLSRPIDASVQSLPSQVPRVELTGTFPANGAHNSRVHELSEAESPSLEALAHKTGTAAQLRGYSAFIPPNLPKPAAPAIAMVGQLPRASLAGPC